MQLAGELWHTGNMSRYQTITFRCREDVFERLESFAARHGIDRTSAIKLALHYYLNLKLVGEGGETSAEQEASSAEDDGRVTPAT